MKRAAIFSGGNFGVRLPCLFQGMIARQRNHAAQFGIELLQSIQIDFRQPFRSNLPGLNPARKLRHGGIRDVGIVGRQRCA